MASVTERKWNLRFAPPRAALNVCAWCGARTPGGTAKLAREVCAECVSDLLESYAERYAAAARVKTRPLARKSV